MKPLVCLISRQVMANLIPILTLNVQKVAWLYTKEEKRAHLNLKRILKDTGLNFQIAEHLVDAYDFEGIQKICETLIQENDNIILNATGGTKVMAFAAYSVFNAAQKPIFYLDSSNNKAIYFNPYLVSEHKVKIPLETMLAAHGYRIVDHEKEEDMLSRKPLVVFLASHYDSLAGSLAQYRRFMYDNNFFFSPTLVPELVFEISWVRKGGVKVKFGRKEIILSDYDYLDGLWLE